MRIQISRLGEQTEAARRVRIEEQKDPVDRHEVANLVATLILFPP